MDLEVLLFASYRELTGAGAVTVRVSPSATVAQLVEAVRGQGDGFARLPARPAVAVNHEVVRHDVVLNPGDEVAFLPPVAGG